MAVRRFETSVTVDPARPGRNMALALVAGTNLNKKLAELVWEIERQGGEAMLLTVDITVGPMPVDKGKV